MICRLLFHNHLMIFGLSNQNNLTINSYNIIINIGYNYSNHHKLELD